MLLVNHGTFEFPENSIPNRNLILLPHFIDTPLYPNIISVSAIDMYTTNFPHRVRNPFHASIPLSH